MAFYMCKQIILIVILSVCLTLALNPMTLIPNIDVDIIKMYQCAKTEVPSSRVGRGRQYVAIQVALQSVQRVLMNAVLHQVWEAVYLLSVEDWSEFLGLFCTTTHERW